MPSNDKIKITQEEFNDIYEIQGITEETVDASNTKNTLPEDTQDTTPKPEPEFLTEEEQIIDDKMYEDLPNTNEEKE